MLNMYLSMCPSDRVYVCLLWCNVLSGICSVFGVGRHKCLGVYICMEWGWKSSVRDA